MSCEKTLLVQASFDGELDAAAAADVEAHLATCAECRVWLETLQGLRAEIRTGAAPRPAPPQLIGAIRSALDEIDKQSARQRSWLAWLRRAAAARKSLLVGACSGALGAAVSAALVIALALPGADQRLLEDVTAAHVRSLMANHLLDVTSSNHHMVKPWFDGRVDVAPPVADLAREGFVLAGGRADYVGGMRVPAVVYRKGRHVINLFSWPAHGGETYGLTEYKGFNVLSWRSHDLVFTAVSDLAPADLRAFARLVQERAGRTTE
jgi:anti-sigma factor RsiW